ncbi:MAG: DUF177 domain-containing protein [Balneolaceae bacterium]
MNDSKLTFRILEIPDGKSTREVELAGEELQIEDRKVLSARVSFRFDRSLHFVKVDFDVNAVMSLQCDRSLDYFEHPVSGSYTVLFKPEAEEISETSEGKIKPFDSRDLTLSLDQEVRDTILLALPIRILHPRFLDESGEPMDFGTKRFGTAGRDMEKSSDPRWEPLKHLKN